MELGTLGVWQFTDGLSAKEAAAFARRIEAMGYSALWIPESMGRHPFAHAAWLLANTTTLVVATGIASIYVRDPGASVAGARTLAEQSDGRFILGLGVSHQPMVEKIRGHVYRKPVATMRNYLTRMQNGRYGARQPNSEPLIVLAALGPKMLALAGEIADGAHPYFTTPEHTAKARAILGPDKLLCVEQKVILETDAEKARALAKDAAKVYLSLENYRNNWRRLGFADDELADSGSDSFIDATFAYGTVEDIRKRIDAHLTAGANHVCIQPIGSQAGMPDEDALAALAP